MALQHGGAIPGGGTRVWNCNMGLIRKIIVVGGALMAMPSPPPDGKDMPGAQNNTPSSSWTFISAAADTVADMKGFCERKPQVCGTAQYLAGSLEGKAKYSAKLVYEWASDRAAGPAPSRNATPSEVRSDPITTASMGLRLTPQIEGRSTLKMEDLIPQWRGTLLPDRG